MIALRLERFGRTQDGTWGNLFSVPTGEQFVYVEPPWHSNRRFESCVETGVYDLIEHDSTKFPMAWALVGDGVSHFEELGVPRFSCLIHAANWPRQLQGCGAPGKAIRFLDGDQAVTHSRQTLARINAMLREARNPKIEIVSTWGQ